MLKKWLALKDIKPTELSARAADEFIRDLRATRRDNGEVMDADSIRLVVAVCSAFYTFLERRFDSHRNRTSCWRASWAHDQQRRLVVDFHKRQALLRLGAPHDSDS